MKNLTSLVSLHICNCPNLTKMQRRGAGWNLQMFTWSNEKEKGCNTEMLQQQALEAKSTTKKPRWNPIWESFSGMELGRRSLMRIDELLIQMKKLEVLRLMNTGNRKPVDLSGCSPQLRVVQVLEPHMKQLRACDLPNLELLVFFGDRRHRHYLYDHLYEELDYLLLAGLDHIGVRTNFGDVSLLMQFKAVAQRSSSHELRAVNFAGCPKVQVVHLRCVSLENELQIIPITSSSSRMKELALNGIRTGSRLPDFTAVAESLERLRFTDVLGFTDLNFTCMYKNLRQLWLSECPSVVQVTRLEGLPVLESLTVRRCDSLKILSGLGGLVGLRSFEQVQLCGNFHFQFLMHDLESLTELENIVFLGHGVMHEALNVRARVTRT